MAKDVIARLKADTSQWNSGLAQATRSMNKFKSDCLSLNNVVGSMSKSLAGLATSYVGPVAAFTAITGAIANNIQTAKEFEKSISGLSSLTGMVGEDLNTLKQYAIDLGGSTTQSASQVAQAFMLIGSQKPELLKNKEALRDVTKAAITLGEAAGIDVTEAAKALTASLNLMGEGADQANRYINILAAGSKEGSVDINGLTEIVFKAGQAASMSKMPFEQFIAVAETIGPKFGSATEAGTALNAMLLKLETQTNSKFKPSIVGLGEAIENLKKANLSSAEASKLVTETGYKALVPLLQNIDATKQLTDAVTGTSTAEDQAKTNTDNLQGSLANLSSAWERFNLTLNDSNGLIRMGVDLLTDLVSGMTTIPSTLDSSRGSLHKFWDDFVYKVQKTELAIRNLDPAIGQFMETFSGTSDFELQQNINRIDKKRHYMSLGNVDATTGAASKQYTNPDGSFSVTPDSGESTKALGAAVANTDKAISDHIKKLKEEREELERGSAEYKKYTAEINKYEQKLGKHNGYKKETYGAEELGKLEEKLQKLHTKQKHATNREAWQQYEDQIKAVQKQIDAITGKGFEDNQIGGLNKKLQELQAAQQHAASTEEWKQYEDQIKQINAQIDFLKTGIIQLPTIKPKFDKSASDELKKEIQSAGIFTTNSLGTLKTDYQNTANNAQIGSKQQTDATAMVADITAFENIRAQFQELGMEMGSDVMNNLLQKIGSGEGVEDADWQALIDTLNAKIAELGGELQPIKIDFSTGSITKATKETKGMTAATREAFNAVNTLGGAMQQIKNPAVNIAGTIAQAIANVALAYGDTMAKDRASKSNIYSFIAAAAAATVSMVTTIAAIKQNAKFADGGIVGGSSYVGDKTPIMANAGEVILNYSQQANLAENLEARNTGQQMQPYATGETIYFGLSTYLRQNGMGEMITTNSR